MVKKPDGSWGPCGDYCCQNTLTVPDRYPLPNIADFSARLHGFKVFIKLYLTLFTLTCCRQHLSLPVSNTRNSVDQLRYGGKFSSNTMKIIHQLLESYNVGVNAGLDLKLNLWTRDWDEFFSLEFLTESF